MNEAASATPEPGGAASPSPERFGIGRLVWRVREAVVVADAASGRIVLWNPAAEAMFGYTATEAVGRPVEIVVPDALRAAHRAGLARFAATGQGAIIDAASPTEVPARHKDGRELVVELSLSALEDDAPARRYALAVIRDVTERRLAEAVVLRTSEERFRQTFALAPFSVQLLAPDGTTLRVNRAWEELWGVTLEQIAGYNILRDPQLVAKGIMPLIERAFAGEPAVLPPVKYEPAQTLAVPGAAPYRWVRGIIYPVTDDTGRVREVVLIHEDITARRKAEDALARQLQLVATISANATLGLVLMDARQRCTFMNPAAEQLTGYTLAEVEGRSLHEVVHHTRPDGTPYPLAECPIDRALPERNRTQGEEVFVHKDGHFHPVAFTASPIVEDGVPVGTVIELADITARKAAEAEREALLARERSARQEAEAAVALRDAFLSVAAHELRTPLTPLRGNLQLLRRALARGAPPDELDRLAARAEYQQERLTRLVTAVLDISRIQGGALVVERAPLDLAALARRVAEQERGAWQPPREISVDALTTAVTVAGDELRLEQVLVNLLENAHKYSPAGTPISVRVWTTPGWAHVAVRDEGVGIPPGEEARIFERFHRAGNIDPGIAGFGLGLSITRQIVEAHDGTLAVDSVPGAGSTFTVALPRGGGS